MVCKYPDSLRGSTIPGLVILWQTVLEICSGQEIYIDVLPGKGSRSQWPVYGVRHTISLRWITMPGFIILCHTVLGDMLWTKIFFDVQPYMKSRSRWPVYGLWHTVSLRWIPMPGLITMSDTVSEICCGQEFSLLCSQAWKVGQGDLFTVRNTPSA